MDTSGVLYTVLISALVMFAVYRRVRRTIGRQRVTPGRFVFRIVVLVVVGVAIFAALLRVFDIGGLAEVFAGLVIGIALGLYGLRLTKFEATEQGAYYIPNRYLGLAVSALLIGRIAYGFLRGSLSGSSPFETVSTGSAPSGSAGLQQAYDPVSSMLLFVFVGYYVVYYFGVLLRARRASAPS